MRNFLGPELPRLADWHFDYRPSEGFAVLPSQHAGKESGLRIANADVVSIFGTFPVISNRDYALQMQADWKIGLDNRVHVHVAWLNREGKRLESLVPLRFPIGESDGSLKVKLPLTAPDHAYDVRVRIVVSRQYSGDYLDISRLDLGTVW